MGNVLGGIGSAPPASNAACNGNAALCSRSYAEVTHVGAHDSSFVGVLPQDNQFVDPAAQLERGVRFLQSQAHDRDGAVHMCHTSCGLEDAGPLRDFLAPVKAWLDANADDVVTVLLTNGDAVDVADFAAVFADVGLDWYAFAPDRKLALNEWPTLQEMIDADDRLVVWMDANADTSKVPYILPEWDYFFETAFGVTDREFPSCDIDRPSGAGADGRMYIVNHFLDLEVVKIGDFEVKIPNVAEAPNTNSVDSIIKQTDRCTDQWGRKPNFVLLDFTTVGDPIGAQNKLNGV